jgi:hypothetical protein
VTTRTNIDLNTSMTMSPCRFLAACALAAICASGSVFAARPALDAGTWNRSGWDRSEVGAIDAEVLDLALRAAACAVRSGAVSDPGTLTVIDYSRPSTAERLWVYDLQKRALLFEELVAHGRESGDNYPTQFSNIPDSRQTSLGLFRTADAYVGSNGYSLRLDGLDKGFNDRARDRAIVMHGAWYVSREVVRAQGRLGRSWGCPAVRAAVAHELIDRVKGGNLVFAYYPDAKWLSTSRYLGQC